MTFRTELGERIYREKYQRKSQTWGDKARTLVSDVCGNRYYTDHKYTENNLIPIGEQIKIEKQIARMEYIPGGRYVYYAGRKASFYNNCFILMCEEDSREEWGRINQRVTSCLMTGGGIGVDYSVIRESGMRLGRTGGESSGPIPLALSHNEIGRNVRQGGSRRSALYGSLNWQHGDIDKWLKIKDWENQQVMGTGFTVADLKRHDFDYNAPLDMMNISVNYDDAWLLSEHPELNEVFIKNVFLAMTNGEPGFSFNFFNKQSETGRNACTEVTSADDSDVCNLGSVNMSRIESMDHFAEVCYNAARFQVCGSVRADVPYEKVAKVRDKNRRIGVGLMGMAEWLAKRGYRYEMNDELLEWMKIYESETERGANNVCDALGISRPVAYRAIAPTGTIGMLAGTTTGIEPVFAVAYLRRFQEQNEWQEVPTLDGTAKILIEQEGVDPDIIETSVDLAADMERRIKFQYEVQKHVDMAISSTINIPGGATMDDAKKAAEIITKYAHGLRGLTFYPDGARGGQPLTPIPYSDIIKKHETNDECKGGVCGV